ncbi:unnamed protein product [Vitrella brassicaformis CCMP3155]|uniref:Uncharacterized protein n=1 Tax=Vitrella brassicaformis (strain CCMP3155) TaxID=1169540 RepID=A0A0G4EKF4_VITBC|nr:unnamed protein product [Vitrella brassicaformis CCMP3155]|eukprot:CEL96902.1 unnamed protein product [Vitrella brassicaformis CCMP3155]
MLREPEASKKDGGAGASQAAGSADGVEASPHRRLGFSSEGYTEEERELLRLAGEGEDKPQDDSVIRDRSGEAAGASQAAREVGDGQRHRLPKAREHSHDRAMMDKTPTVKDEPDRYSELPSESKTPRVDRPRALDAAVEAFQDQGESNRRHREGPHPHLPTPERPKTVRMSTGDRMSLRERRNAVSASAMLGMRARRPKPVDQHEPDVPLTKPPPKRRGRPPKAAQKRGRPSKKALAFSEATEDSDETSGEAPDWLHDPAHDGLRCLLEAVRQLEEEGRTEGDRHKQAPRDRDRWGRKASSDADMYSDEGESDSVYENGDGESQGLDLDDPDLYQDSDEDMEQDDDVAIEDVPVKRGRGRPRKGQRGERDGEYKPGDKIQAAKGSKKRQRKSGKALDDDIDPSLHRLKDFINRSARAQQQQRGRKGRWTCGVSPDGGPDEDDIVPPLAPPKDYDQSATDGKSGVSDLISEHTRDVPPAVMRKRRRRRKADLSEVDIDPGTWAELERLKEAVQQKAIMERSLNNLPSTPAEGAALSRQAIASLMALDTTKQLPVGDPELPSIPELKEQKKREIEPMRKIAEVLEALKTKTAQAQTQASTTTAPFQPGKVRPPPLPPLPNPPMAGTSPPAAPLVPPSAVAAQFKAARKGEYTGVKNPVVPPVFPLDAVVGGGDRPELMSLPSLESMAGKGASSASGSGKQLAKSNLVPPISPPAMSFVPSGGSRSNTTSPDTAALALNALAAIAPPGPHPFPFTLPHNKPPTGPTAPAAAGGEEREAAAQLSDVRPSLFALGSLEHFTAVGGPSPSTSPIKRAQDPNAPAAAAAGGGGGVGKASVSLEGMEEIPATYGKEKPLEQIPASYGGMGLQRPDLGVVDQAALANKGLGGAAHTTFPLFSQSSAAAALSILQPSAFPTPTQPPIKSALAPNPSQHARPLLTHPFLRPPSADRPTSHSCPSGPGRANVTVPELSGGGAADTSRSGGPGRAAKGSSGRGGAHTGKSSKRGSFILPLVPPVHVKRKSQANHDAQAGSSDAKRPCLSKPPDMDDPEILPSLTVPRLVPPAAPKPAAAMRGPSQTNLAREAGQSVAGGGNGGSGGEQGTDESDGSGRLSRGAPSGSGGGMAGAAMPQAASVVVD